MAFPEKNRDTPPMGRGEVFASGKYPKVSTNPDKPLTPKQLDFIQLVVRDGLSATTAARQVGGDATNWMKMANVQRAMELEREAFAKDNQMTRKRVVDGFLEAIDIARLQGEPMVMVSGWREVGRMCGFYEPTRHKIELTVNGQVQLEKMHQMSNEELLRLAEEGNDPLEGDYEVIND
jgi:hypothetical protein